MEEEEGTGRAERHAKECIIPPLLVPFFGACFFSFVLGFPRKRARFPRKKLGGRDAVEINSTDCGLRRGEEGGGRSLMGGSPIRPPVWGPPREREREIHFFYQVRPFRLAEERRERRKDFN